MTRKRLKMVALDPDFIRDFRVLAAANGKSMAEISRELGRIDGGIKRLKEKLKLL